MATTPRPLTEAEVHALDEASTDGQVLIIREGDCYDVVIRNDAEAENWNTPPRARWLGDYASEPMDLWQHCQDADEVLAVGDALLSRVPVTD